MTTDMEREESETRDKPDRALVQWLWEETHDLKVVGLNPGTVYWMDIFHIYLL